MKVQDILSETYRDDTFVDDVAALVQQHNKRRIPIKMYVEHHMGKTRIALSATDVLNYDDSDSEEGQQAKQAMVDISNRMLRKYGSRLDVEVGDFNVLIRQR